MALAVRPPSGPYTYARLRTLPDDGLRYEIVDGELLVSPAPRLAHQSCVKNLLLVIARVLPPHLDVLAAPVDWYISEATVVEPDVVVFRRDDAGPLRLDRPPVLAVEVLSPGTRRRDRGVKRRAYERAGLGWYWLVDPDVPRLTVLELVGGRYEAGADVSGDDQYEATEPFAVSLSPAALLR
jgi:Uma2 family endonuclease